MTEMNAQSSAELIKRAGEQMSTLVRTEIALAQAELAGKARNAGTAAGLFGGAGVIAFYAVGVLIAAGVLGLAVVWPAWLSALVVGVALLVVTGVLAMVGRSRAKRVGSLVPERALHGLQADFATVSHPGSGQLTGGRGGGELSGGRLADERLRGHSHTRLGDSSSGGGSTRVDGLSSANTRLLQDADEPAQWRR